MYLNRSGFLLPGGGPACYVYWPSGILLTKGFFFFLIIFI